MAKAADSLYFYAISRDTTRRVDELLRERLPLQPPGLPSLHTLQGA